MAESHREHRWRQARGLGLFSLTALGSSFQVKKDSANQHPKMEDIQFQALLLVEVSLTGYFHHQRTFYLPVPREWGLAELPGLAFPHCAGMQGLLSSFPHPHPLLLSSYTSISLTIYTESTPPPHAQCRHTLPLSSQFCSPTSPVPLHGIPSGSEGDAM